MKSRKKLALILLITGVLVIASSIAGYFLSDRQKFLTEGKKLDNLISELKSETEISNFSTERFCERNNLKFSAGSLVCMINYAFNTPVTDIATQAIKSKSEALRWQYKGENTKATNEYSEIKYLKHEVFTSEDFICLVSMREDKEEYLHEIKCSRPARAAWYPVKSD